MSPEGPGRAPLKGWTGGLEECSWGEIQRPGCYVFIDTGDLVRVPLEGLSARMVPVISIISRDDRRLARVSHDHTEALQVLRTIAATGGYKVNF